MRVSHPYEEKKKVLSKAFKKAYKTDSDLPPRMARKDMETYTGKRNPTHGKRRD